MIISSKETISLSQCLKNFVSYPIVIADSCLIASVVYNWCLQCMLFLKVKPIAVIISLCNNEFCANAKDTRIIPSEFFL